MLRPGRKAPAKKVNKCLDGGYKSFMLRIISRGQMNCAICEAAFRAKEVDYAQVDLAVQEWLAGKRPETFVQRPVQKEKQEDQVDTEGEIEKAEKIDDRAEAHAFLKTLEPHLVLLPAGSFGKRIPLKCNVCKTPGWPDGKVLELDVMKLNSVTRFASQHINGTCHQRSLRRASEGPIVVQMVDCQGLCVTDHTLANKLYQYRNEFSLWAQHANFAGCARHSYSLHATTGQWMVRSAYCLKQCRPRDAEIQTCDKCQELGGSRGVSWLKGALVFWNVFQCFNLYQFIWFSTCCDFSAYVGPLVHGILMHCDASWCIV